MKHVLSVGEKLTLNVERHYMSDNKHVWEMTDINFGFIVFEKCFHCDGLRTYFSHEENPILGDRYREGDCHWTRMENAQSFTFNLKCTQTGQVEKFDDLMGLMYCTDCMSDCELHTLCAKYQAEHTMIIIAFGFLPEAISNSIPQYKLDILTNYFNQKRDTSRSRIIVLPFNLIKNLQRCKGDFLHDVDMLSQELPKERKPVF